MTDTRDKAGWVHFINADDAGQELTELHLEPNEADLKKIAELIGILELKSLKADLRFKRVQGGLVVKVSGDFKADVVQACVVTLDPIESHIDDNFTAWFADPAQAISFNKALKQRDMEKKHGETPIVDEKDDPEVIVDGKIDIGDTITQFLSLSLDPYPHKEGVQYEVGDDTPQAKAAGVRKNPFDKLKEWKDKQNT